MKETEKHFFLVMRTQDPLDSWPPEPPGKLTWRAAVLAELLLYTFDP